MDSKLIIDATLGTLDGSLSFPEILGNELVRMKIKDKNERAAKSRTLKISVSATNGRAANGNNSQGRNWMDQRRISSAVIPRSSS